MARVDSEKIAALLRPYIELRLPELRNISIYIDILRKWNARINLTAVREPEEIVTRHFGESFFAAARLLTPSSRVEVIDVGSGAGFPGLPMAMFSPSARFTLIESSSKKASFLNEVIDALKLENTKVFNGRAEDYPATADLVTMRAVEKFEKSLTVASTLVRPGGRLALMIGTTQERKARSLVGEFSWQLPIHVPGSESRVLAVGTREVKVE